MNCDGAASLLLVAGADVSWQRAGPQGEIMKHGAAAIGLPLPAPVGCRTDAGSTAKVLRHRTRAKFGKSAKLRPVGFIVGFPPRGLYQFPNLYFLICSWIMLPETAALPDDAHAHTRTQMLPGTAVTSATSTTTTTTEVNTENSPNGKLAACRKQEQARGEMNKDLQPRAIGTRKKTTFFFFFFSFQEAMTKSALGGWGAQVSSKSIITFPRNNFCP